MVRTTLRLAVPPLSVVTRRRAIPALAVALGAGVIGAALGGCSPQLLAPTDERSQYDRYDRVRSKYSEQYVEDAYGVRSPNLKARLAPRD